MGTQPIPFGKYELISRLAAGGMAEIFLARTRSIQGFEKYLVIKKILQSRTTDPDFVRMFLDEARVAATLDHPNIVQIYDVGNFEDEYFIAMEYLRGHNLIEIVRAGAKLGYSKPPLEHVMSVLSGVCAGLHYAHEKRDFQGRPLAIVHRDVTPQNIVISFDGAVKIVDFGIAKAATREVETLAGTLKGKIGYMSPEQCRGLAVDRRSDLFTVGIILYELTTGKRLYHERSDFETLKKIIEGPVPSPRDILPFYPAALSGIVVRCLQKSPDDRYQTARELHADLDAFSRDNQLVTGTVPLGQFMERVFADELAASRNTDASGMVFASQMATSASGPSYLGESSSRRSGQLEVPLDKARRKHLLTRAAQLVLALLLVLSGGLAVWWRTRAAPRAAQASSVAGAKPALAQPGAQPIATAPLVKSATALPAPSLPEPKSAQPEPAPVMARPRPVARPGDAHITVASEPRCELLVDGEPYGATPVVDLAVPAGRHTLILLDSVQGIKEVQKVRLSSGELWTRSFQLEDGRMVERKGLSPKMLVEAAPVRPQVAAPAPVKPEPSVRPAAVTGPASGGAAPERAIAPPPAPRPRPTTHPAPTSEPAPRTRAGASEPARTIAGFVLDAQKLSTPAPHLPEFVMRRQSGGTLVGTYKICVDEAGHVYDVKTVSSISGADAEIMSTLRHWRYRPRSGRVCAAKQFVFKLQ
ncbi:MAG TPA: protein kinase [Polyangia bacterium]